VRWNLKEAGTAKRWPDEQEVHQAATLGEVAIIIKALN
jgi:hypothetical protein